MVIERYLPFRGGSETQCHLLSTSLAARGVSVFVVTRRFERSLSKEERLHGIQVFRVPPSGFGRVWVEFGFACSAAWLLLKKRHAYDILHIHGGTSIAGMIFLLLAKMLGKKTVIKIATAGDITKERIEVGAAVRRPSILHRAMNAWINAVLRRADRIIALTKEIEHELLRHGFATSHTVRIANAVDTRLFAPVDPAEKRALRQKLGLPNDKLIVLFSGRLIRRKGVDVLLDAWYRLGALHAGAILVILGSGGRSLDNIENDIQSQIAKCGHETSVMFVGERTNVHEFLQAADVFVFPSRREGMPNALLEAMSTGLPVLASAVGGNIDVIESGVTGLLFPSEDVDRLAHPLQRLLTDNSLRSTLGEQARRAIRERYSVEALLPRYLTLYDSLINA